MQDQENLNRIKPATLGVATPFLLLTALGACTVQQPESQELLEALPVMAWDQQGSHTDEWTEATLAALESEGAALLSHVPADISTWCPDYLGAEPEERAAFWAGLLSALARFESTWNPQAVGGGGRWFGLVQIAPATARGYGCEADTGAELTDGAANLECAVEIAARTVTRDGVVAAGGGGFAADWGPFASASKRAEMAQWVSRQDYCQA